MQLATQHWRRQDVAVLASRARARTPNQGLLPVGNPKGIAIT